MTIIKVLTPGFLDRGGRLVRVAQRNTGRRLTVPDVIARAR
jgi:hypothetical protein